jgi:hypothetical protein
MSPLFHRSEDDHDKGERQGHLPSLAELGPQLDEVVTGAASQPLEEFATQLMKRYFTTDQVVASELTSVVSVDTICWDLLPDNSGEHAGEAIPDGFFALQDLVTEAMQLLRTAGLVMQRSYKVRQDHMDSQWLDGLVTTRRGRAALTDDSVRQILAQVYSPRA